MEMESKLVVARAWGKGWGVTAYGDGISLLKKKKKGTSLVVQWLRICLAMQRTLV